MERAKWRSGNYNSHRLDLGNGIEASVNWAVTGEKGYIARTLGRDVGTFPELKDAQKAAENALRMALREAIVRLA